MAFEYTFRGADMPDLAPRVRDLLENRDQELELFLSTIGSGGSTPSGSMSAFAGSSAPFGWLLCDGSVVSQSTYASLYAVIGATYNTGGEGAGNFRLPNLKGRVIVGYDSADVDFDALGETGGSKDVTLSINEMPTHNHDIGLGSSGFTDNPGDHSHTSTDFPNAPTQTYDAGTTRFGRNSVANGMTSSLNGQHTHEVFLYSEGGNTAHNNLQPYIALNWIIKT